MKFKLDENLGKRTLNLFREAVELYRESFGSDDLPESTDEDREQADLDFDADETVEQADTRHAAEIAYKEDRLTIALRLKDRAVHLAWRNVAGAC